VNVSQDDNPEGTESLTLVASNTGGSDFSDESTINDAGQGSIFLGNNITDTPNQPGDTDPNGPDYPAQLDDDRELTVTGTAVNEASPYVLWTVGGAVGQKVLLDLQAGSTSPSATLGTDSGNDAQLEVLVGGQWVDYDPSNPPVIAAGGELLVRVNVSQDDNPEGTESLTLVASNTGGSDFSDESTINDAGQGSIFLGNNITGTPNQPGDTDPNGPDYPAQLDDDRALSLQPVTVNEGSPYAVFTVSGAAGQLATLGLADQNADGTNLSQIEYLDGNVWKPYSSGAVPLDAQGKLLVRVAISPEQEAALDGPETFSLVARNTGGAAFKGVGTIVDDGTGDYFAADNKTATPAVPAGIVLDDDRPVLPPPVSPVAPLATPLEPLPQVPATVHVQREIAEQRQAQASGNQSGAQQSNLSAAVAGDQVQHRLDQLIEKFDRPTDPNLFVLPAVQDARMQANEAKLPVWELQSGALIEAFQSASPVGGALPLASLTTMAEITLAELQQIRPTVVAPLAFNDGPLPPAQDALVGEERRAEVPKERLIQKGQLGFSQQLQMKLAQRTGGVRPSKS
jgi:hypothetical protein